jgi:hypothetical protein
MGNSYSSAPKEWRTITRGCQGCGAGFVVTAGEQQYLYEVLGTFYFVQTSYCRECRKRHRTHRRIITRLAELMPQVDSGAASSRELRETVLVIAEGTLRRTRDRQRRTEDWVLSGKSILIKGSGIIGSLRRAARPHHDLLPILRHFQLRLGNEKRALRVAQEIEQAKAGHPSLAKAIAAIEAWMENPTRRTLEPILDQPRHDLDCP